MAEVQIKGKKFVSQPYSFQLTMQRISARLAHRLRVNDAGGCPLPPSLAKGIAKRRDR
jgi:hypothetical protein